MKNLAPLALAFAVTSSALTAQVVYSTAGSSYSQNFDALTNPGTTSGTTNFSWTPNSTITGWYYTAPTTVNTAFNTGDFGRAANQLAATTSFNSNRVFSLSDSAAVANNAMGMGTGGTTPTEGAMFGVRFTNTTGSTLNQFTLGYTGQQWLQGSTGGSLELYYHVAPNNTAPTAFGTGGIDILANGTLSAALSFNSLQTGTASTLDGTLAANQSSISGTVSGLTWNHNTDLYLVWRKTGTATALAIDDLSFSAVAIPEPSAFAALAGLGALGLAAARRDRRRGA